MRTTIALKTLLVVIMMVLPISLVHAQQLQSWMHPDVSGAWKKKFKGQGTSITIVDQFSSSDPSDYIDGNLSSRLGGYRLHGDWVSKHTSMIATSAKINARDWSTAGAVKLSKGLNIFNMSYAIMDVYSTSSISWDAQESSLIFYATSGKAVVVKAAGNEYGTAVGGMDSDGYLDYLNRDLIGKKSAIFVGALSTHGTTSSKASLADYSNIAGSDIAVQNNFLVVGVRGDLTGLHGTSFAAPVVSAYAAMLGRKFKKASATQITNQLFLTARTDTILGYSAYLHGRGEASLVRALAPKSIK